MCGIAVEMRFNGHPADVDAVSAMMSQMHARGPDDAGVFALQSCAFGHRRLKVIDLSSRSAQPMIDSQLGICIVFNGCIYNHGELRRQLEKMGYTFFSAGDTEVILKAYHAWGTDCVRHFNGMFAFVLRERESGRVFAARDRLGIKPLYYSEIDHGIRFCSSLPALLEPGGTDTAVDATALHHYMSFHAVVPAPRTILKGVRKLPPASWMLLEADGQRREEAWWSLGYPAEQEREKRSFEEWQALVLDALRRAVQRRRVADVDVGVLLSGGLDSSLITGLLAESGQEGLQTFSIGFESAGGEKGDEFAYSDVVAARFNTRHHRIHVPSERLLPALPDCVAAMSEPMVSHDVIAFYLLSREVSRHVKVVQSGQGADEVFGGYHWYPPMLEKDAGVADYQRLFIDRTHDEFAAAVNPEFVQEDFSCGFVDAHFGSDGAYCAIDRALRLDTTVMLVDDPVKRVDNMTMAWGLEARVPFLDHELVELAARVPAGYKVAEGGKHVLKEAARAILPAAIIDRPKAYFPVPALKYIRGEYRELVRDVLDSRAARERNLFRREYVNELLDSPEEYLTPLGGSKLWQLAVLEYWLQTHRI
ncbi:MAG TPA: N-acetylglutaminylglutamine amidotransferase, partial [Gammaproteobacteria bacterium]